MKKLLALLLCVVMLCSLTAVLADDSDLAYVQEKGVLVVGITDFEPMDYKKDGEWIGFDADLAKAFAASIGIDVEFIEIDWNSKILELNNKNIDCVWNGMTLTDEVLEAMEPSNGYVINAQVVVIPADKADAFQSADALAGLIVAVEAGSAGQATLEELGLDLTVNEVQDQATAIMEVAAGTSDAAVIDRQMAVAMTGEGTSYANLTFVLPLNEEVYGVGFRKGSDLAALLNDFFAASWADGSMQALGETYGIAEALIPQE